MLYCNSGGIVFFAIPLIMGTELLLMAKLTAGVALEFSSMTAVVLNMAALAAEVTVGRATSRRLAAHGLPAILVVICVS